MQASVYISFDALALTISCFKSHAIIWARLVANLIESVWDDYARATHLHNDAVPSDMATCGVTQDLSIWSMALDWKIGGLLLQTDHAFGSSNNVLC